tara:strand:+ start:33369 stop:33941 length:573 start_codon:yes stop_codon:yes gene_type:complete
MDPVDNQYMQQECGKVSVSQYYTASHLMYKVRIVVTKDYIQFVTQIPIGHHPSTFEDGVLTVTDFRTNISAHLFGDAFLIKLMTERGRYIIKHYDELRECYAKLYMEYKDIESKKHTLEQEMKWLSASREAIEEQVHGPNSNYSKAYVEAVASMNPQAPIFVPVQALVEEAKKSGTTARLTSSTGYWTDS